MEPYTLYSIHTYTSRGNEAERKGRELEAEGIESVCVREREKERGRWRDRTNGENEKR